MKVNITLDLAPFLPWIRSYDKDKFTRDLIAGLTVAAVLVPQSMAYALLAGMPPIYGLYASFLPVIVAALFGSSRFLATGPVAMTALLTSSVLYGLAEPGSDRWIALAGVLALMVGFIRLMVGIFKLAFVVELISTSVIVGFTSASIVVDYYMISNGTICIIGLKINSTCLINLMINPEYPSHPSYPL